jgi:hypothetical protein
MKMNVQKVEHNTTGGVHLPKYTIHTSTQTGGKAGWWGVDKSKNRLCLVYGPTGLDGHVLG